MFTEAQLKDSLSRLEKRKETEFTSRLEEIRERNRETKSETGSATENIIDVNHKGGETVVETPDGKKLVITGTGDVNVRSSSTKHSFTKEQIAELNRITSEKTELKIENENLITELKTQQFQITDLEEQLRVEKTKEVKSAPCNRLKWFLYGFALGISVMVLLFIFRKQIGVAIPFLKAIKFFR
jgi:hypothetical protein